MSFGLKKNVIAVSIAAALLSTFGFTSNQAVAAAPMVKTQAPGYYRFMLGNFEVTALSDGTVDLPVDKLLHGKPSEISRDLAQSFERAPLETSVNAYLINTGSKLVLIDTGSGITFGPTLGKLLGNLEAAGYKPAQIDDIFLTHLHPDHVGGMVTKGAIAFPNATVPIDSREEDFWLSKTRTDAAPADGKKFFADAQTSLAPYIEAKKIVPFKGGAELLPGITSVPTPGHTAGHTSYLVESNGQKLLVVGDLLHVAAVQLKNPAVTIAFDSDEKLAYSSRMKMLAEIEKQGEIVAAAHLSFPGVGHLRKTGKSWQWIPLNYTTQFPQ